MLAEIGQAALILALIASIIQGIAPLVGAPRRDAALMAMGPRAAIAAAGFVLVAYAALTILFVTSDFSVRMVAAYSHTMKPMIYKVSGVWGNHEGSMLLWIMMLTLFGAAMALFASRLPKSLQARAVAIQGLLSVGFLAFLLFTSNPFERLNPVPLNGNGLNPLLQDPGLAFHPPFLYLGYVGFSVAFSFAVAALLEGRVDAAWARWVRPWVLAAWSFLTIGITLGSLWAYYELGWGGWWFWDPVENVSLMPWLAGTALLHSVLVVEKRHTLTHWTLLLAIATFSLSLVGTFIVRSGVLTSVHAFAVDPERGVFILGLLILYTGGALVLYALRSARLAEGAQFEAVSREGGLVLNNLLLVSATATVFLGTFYPLLVDAMTNEKLTVGPPYFNFTFLPIMSVLILFMGAAPLLKWRQDDIRRLRMTLMILGGLAVAVLALVTVFGKAVLGAIGIALVVYLIASASLAYGKRFRAGQVPLSGSLTLWRRLPAGVHGFYVAHVGVAVMSLGITGISVWSVDKVDRLQVGDTLALGAYELTLDEVSVRRIQNYESEMALFTLSRQGSPLTVFDAERRYYPVEQNMTTEAALDIRPLRTVFATIGEGTPNTGWQVRIYIHSLVSWIWIGALIMAFGGFVALTERRRVATPKPVQAQAIPQAAE